MTKQDEKKSSDSDSRRAYPATLSVPPQSTSTSLFLKYSHLDLNTILKNPFPSVSTSNCPIVALAANIGKYHLFILSNLAYILYIEMEKISSKDMTSVQLSPEMSWDDVIIKRRRSLYCEHVPIVTSSHNNNNNVNNNKFNSISSTSTTYNNNIQSSIPSSLSSDQHIHMDFNDNHPVIRDANKIDENMNFDKMLNPEMNINNHKNELLIDEVDVEVEERTLEEELEEEAFIKVIPITKDFTTILHHREIVNNNEEYVNLKSIHQPQISKQQQNNSLKTKIKSSHTTPERNYNVISNNMNPFNSNYNIAEANDIEIKAVKTALKELGSVESLLKHFKNGSRQNSVPPVINDTNDTYSVHVFEERPAIQMNSQESNLSVSLISNDPVS